MRDTAQLLERIRRIREELDALELLLRGGSALIEPLIEDEITIEGESDLEITGGVATSRFPDCCAVGNDQGYFCTGTLIAPNLVVTAKHCAGVSRAFFGTNVAQPQNGETIIVDRAIAHPDADLRVLVLQQAAQAMPRHVAQGAEVGNPRTAIVAGFGHTNPEGTQGYGIKRYARVPIMSLDSSPPADMQYGGTPGIELVAGHLGLRRDTCKGDSGGPLYIADPNGNGYFLLGATARGAINAQHECGDGGIYVRVDQFLDWIRTETGIAVEGPLAD